MLSDSDDGFDSDSDRHSEVEVNVVEENIATDKGLLEWEVRQIKEVYDDGTALVAWRDTIEIAANLVGANSMVERRKARQQKLKEEMEKKAEERLDNIKKCSVTKSVLTKQSIQHLSPKGARRSRRLQQKSPDFYTDSSGGKDYRLRKPRRKNSKVLLSTTSDADKVEVCEKWLKSKYRPDWGSIDKNITEDSNDENITGSSLLNNNDNSIILEQPEDNGGEGSILHSLEVPDVESIEESLPITLKEQLDSVNISTEPCTNEEEDDGCKQNSQEPVDVEITEKTAVNNEQMTCPTFEMKSLKLGFSCDLCSKVLSSRKNLKLHVRNVHKVDGLQKAAYTFIGCTLCGSPMSSKFHLTSHMKTVHPNNTVPCVYCQKKGSCFRSFVELQEHIKVEHGHNTVFQCVDCSKYFARKFCLERHSGRCVVKKMKG